MADGERYVAGIDMGGPHSTAVLTVGRVDGGVMEVVSHEEWPGLSEYDLAIELALRLRREWKVQRVDVEASVLSAAVIGWLSHRLNRHVLRLVQITPGRKERLLEQVRLAIADGRVVMPEEESHPLTDDYHISLALAARAAGILVQEVDGGR